MKVVAVVQARAGSRRLPEKVLMDVGGLPMVTQVLRRVSNATRLDEIVLATTTRQEDDALERLAASEGLRCFRGSERDVLGRYLAAATDAQADVVVRVTADCPLIDPWLVDLVVEELLRRVGECDMASNVVRRTFPRGLDAEVLFVETLARLDQLAVSDAAREHVTWFVYKERPDLFRPFSVELPDEDYSQLDWSVDTQMDLDFIREIYERLDLGNNVVPWREILELGEKARR